MGCGWIERWTKSELGKLFLRGGWRFWPIGVFFKWYGLLTRENWILDT